MNFLGHENVVLPNYEHSILCTITSILKKYGVDSNHTSSELLDNILKDKKYKNVIFLILDGLGEKLLENVSKDGFLSNNKIDVVTSVYPSTTTAALTSYYSGMSPYETGWIAWSQYFKEYGRTIDMFSQKESYMQDVIKKPIMDVFKDVMKYESVYKKIEAASPEVWTHEIGPEYARRLGNRRYVAENIDDIFMYVKDIIGNSKENFILAYSDKPDSLLHEFGTDSAEVVEFIKSTEAKISEFSKELTDDTLLIISADHGHKNIEKSYTLLDYPDIQECLIMPAYLESRVLTFWVKDDMKADFEARFNSHFGAEFILLSKDDFINKYHFLGYGEKHKKIDDFIGHYVALSTAGAMIRIESFLTHGKVVKKSTHCGLSEEEMLVPLIVIK